MGGRRRLWTTVAAREAASDERQEKRDELQAGRFHPLLVIEAMLSLKDLPVFAALLDIRTNIKTAWRFCFSPHDRTECPATRRPKIVERRLSTTNRVKNAGYATSITGRQNAPEQPGQLSGSAQNFTGCGSENTSAGNFSSSTTHTPAPRRIVCVSALSGPMPPIE